MSATATERASAAAGDRGGRELLVFFCAAFAASWLIGGAGFFVLGLGVAGLAMGTASLAVTALALTYRSTGTVRPLLRQVLRWRVHPVWYGAALGLPLLLAGLALLVIRLLGGSVAAAASPGLGAVLLTLPLHFLVGGLEEPGWRGYALPRLQRRWSALTATLLLAGVWMLWHLPLFLVVNPVFDQIPLGPYLFVGVASSVVYTWIYNSTGGSVLLVMALHAAKNATLVWLTGLLAWSVFATLWVLAAVLVAAAAGPLDLSSRRRFMGGDPAPGAGAPGVQSREPGRRLLQVR